MTALSVSLLAWWAESSFYDRFGPLASGLPSWDPWLLLDLGVQLVAWAVVGALWLWWPRRHVVAIVTALLLGALGLAAHAWVQHEADRVQAGTPVWPKSVLPFDFSAQAVTMIPYGTPSLPEGVPSQPLLLRFDPESRTVLLFDPATQETLWVDNDVASPSFGGRG